MQRFGRVKLCLVHRFLGGFLLCLFPCVAVKSNSIADRDVAEGTSMTWTGVNRPCLICQAFASHPSPHRHAACSCLYDLLASLSLSDSTRRNKVLPGMIRVYAMLWRFTVVLSEVVVVMVVTVVVVVVVVAIVGVVVVAFPCPPRYFPACSPPPADVAAPHRRR